MKKKPLILFLIIVASLFFVVSMIIATNKFVSSAHKNADEYLSKKEISISGSILSFDKVSGKNKVVEIIPSEFKNKIDEQNNSMGFFKPDTSKVFVVLNFPNEFTKADSLSTTATKTIYYKNGTIVGETKPELMRWTTIQNLKLTTEKIQNINLVYLY